ncbi:MAG: PorV/PorQ family protein [Calditrichaeota bacterium]|nr:PorV/PorQ family protein [Calditrichota bacterium]RQW08149.1 MAG: PorV/PorQ family protein [Calditrichota bacterium]
MTEKKITGLFVLLSIFLVYCSLHADGLKFRKYAGEFMEIGVDARAQAMGGAFTAMPGGVTSTYYNPAGMTAISGTQFSFMHTQQMIASVNYDFLAAGYRQADNRIIGISLVRLGIDNIKDSRQAQRIISQSGDWNLDISRITEFNSSDYIFTLSVAQQWRGSWTWGANVKLIRRDLAEFSANGIGMDLGIQKSVLENGLLGASFKNFTTTLISWNTGEKELITPSMHLGGSYLLNIPSWKSSFQPTADAIFRAENRRESATAHLGKFSLDYAAGLEYSYYQIVYLRTGIDEISRLNVGIGIQIPHIRIDYAFSSFDNELGNSHRIGLLVVL